MDRSIREARQREGSARNSLAHWRTMLSLLAAFVLMVATTVNPVGAQESSESSPEDSVGDDSETQTESMPPLVIGGGNSAEVPSGFSGVLGRFHIVADRVVADDDSAVGDSADSDSADDDSADTCADDDNADDEVQWSLSGPDSDLLQISNSGVLCFAAPQYAQFVGGNDANGDDVFEVTVEASTSAGRSGSADTSVGVIGDGPRVIDIHLGPPNPDERLILKGERSVYYPGDTISATVTFGYGDAPISVRVGGSPRLMLNVGGTTRVAEYSSSHQSQVFFEYTVAADDEDANGVSIDKNSLRLNGGSIADSNGSKSPLTYSQVASSPDHVVRPVPFEITGPTSLTRYGGAKFVYRFTTAENKWVRWILIGPDSQHFQASGEVGDSGKTVDLLFASPPDHATPLDGDGQNDYEVTIVAIAEEDILHAEEIGFDIGRIGGYEASIDLVVTVVAPPPEIDNISFGQSPGRNVSSGTSLDDGNYAVGDVITVNVEFDTSVTVTGTPQIALDIGGVERLADYHSTDAAVVVFRYTVVEGDADSDGVTIPANSLRLNGGTIANADGTAAELKHTAVEGGSSQRVATPGGL